MKKRRALILYATMTKNTEKIAECFRSVFDEYNWDVTMLRIRNSADIVARQDEVYFDDYDVICLGSPIVAGAPLQPIVLNFSLGGGINLEQKIHKEIEEGPGSKGAMPPMDPSAGKGSWRRGSAPYAGVLNRTDNRPLGIVFCTYGGGFFGSSECMPVLDTLKLYLNTYSVDVVGFFACAGREHGPAGYDLGVKPKASYRPGPADPNAPDADVCDPVVYTMKDGTKRFGSYFFHYDGNSKPSPRDEVKAKSMIADFIEDYFMTYDGERNPPLSNILSIS